MRYSITTSLLLVNPKFNLVNGTASSGSLVRLLTNRMLAQ